MIDAAVPAGGEVKVSSSGVLEFGRAWPASQLVAERFELLSDPLGSPFPTPSAPCSGNAVASSTAGAETLHDSELDELSQVVRGLRAADVGERLVVGPGELLIRARTHLGEYSLLGRLQDAREAVEFFGVVAVELVHGRQGSRLVRKIASLDLRAFPPENQVFLQAIPSRSPPDLIRRWRVVCRAPSGTDVFSSNRIETAWFAHLWA